MEELHCPECDAVIYTRRAGVCESCGKALPESFLFDEHQTEILNTELDHAKAALQKVADESDENLPGGFSTEMEVIDRTGPTEP